MVAGASEVHFYDVGTIISHQSRIPIWSNHRLKAWNMVGSEYGRPKEEPRVL